MVPKDPCSPAREPSGNECSGARDRPACEIRNTPSKYALIAAAAILLVHVLLLGLSAVRHSPVRDELGHLPAGISHWQYGRFELYRVNPPLVRMVAALPVMLAGCQTDWRAFDSDLHERCEYAVGRDFVTANGPRAFWLYTLARWTCIPFSLLGAVVVFLWSRELYGVKAGLAAMTLWCFSPDILGHGSLMMPDAAAAATGAAAGYTFWRWLRSGSLRSAILAGVFLGLALLTKLTWVFLLVLLPAIWFMWQVRSNKLRIPTLLGRSLSHLALVLGIGLGILNMGYGFRGSLMPLGEMQFVSRALAGEAAQVHGGCGNRFAGTWLGALPLPVPCDYLQGIDIQRSDFEREHWSYLGGRWQLGGWWFYYLYGLAVKIPLAFWVLVALAATMSVWGKQRVGQLSDELVLAAPAALVLIIVSS